MSRWQSGSVLVHVRGMRPGTYREAWLPCRVQAGEWEQTYVASHLNQRNGSSGPWTSHRLARVWVDGEDAPRLVAHERVRRG